MCVIPMQPGGVVIGDTILIGVGFSWLYANKYIINAGIDMEAMRVHICSVRWMHGIHSLHFINVGLIAELVYYCQRKFIPRQKSQGGAGITTFFLGAKWAERNTRMITPSFKIQIHSYIVENWTTSDEILCSRTKNLASHFEGVDFPELMKSGSCNAAPLEATNPKRRPNATVRLMASMHFYFSGILQIELSPITQQHFFHTSSHITHLPPQTHTHTHTTIQITHVSRKPLLFFINIILIIIIIISFSIGPL